MFSFIHNFFLISKFNLRFFWVSLFSSSFSSAHWKPIEHLQNAANNLVNNVQNAFSGISNGYPNNNNNNYGNRSPNNNGNYGNGHHTHGIISDALGTSNLSAQQAIQASKDITQNVHNFVGNTIDKLTGGRNNNIINSGLNKLVGASNGIAQNTASLAANTIDKVVGGTQSVFGKLGHAITNWG